VAWSPLNQERGLLAVGTVANAIDDSFETTADLEVMAVDFGSGKEMTIKGSVKCNERFHRLAWSGMTAGTHSEEYPLSLLTLFISRTRALTFENGLPGSTTLPLGLLAGGMVDGSIGLWNPAVIAKQMQVAIKNKGKMRLK